MAEPTIETMLANVRTAMNDALVSGGEVEFEINGRRRRMDYNQLLEVEARLMQRQAATAATTQPGGLRTYAEFGSRPS